jgi:hypothetical protein
MIHRTRIENHPQNPQNRNDPQNSAEIETIHRARRIEVSHQSWLRLSGYRPRWRKSANQLCKTVTVCVVRFSSLCTITKGLPSALASKPAVGRVARTSTVGS